MPWQVQFADSLLPERVGPVNINNYVHVDTLLTHLETPEMPLPSFDALRVVFTLAGRHMDINYSNYVISSQGVQSTESLARAMRDAYNNAPYKYTFQARSVFILQKYVSVARNDPNSPFYNLLVSLVREFTHRLWSVNKYSTMKTGSTVPRVVSRRPQSQSDVTHFFRPVTDEKKDKEVEKEVGKEVKGKEGEETEEAAKETEKPGEKAEETGEDAGEAGEEGTPNDYVSDSDPETSVLKTTLYMEEEVNKYQSFNLGQDQFFSRSLSPKPDEPAKGSSKSGSSKSGPSKGPDLIAPLSKGHETNKPSFLRVFDEPLLSERLNARLHPNYGPWVMINWCFHCASTHGPLYAVHSGVISFLWDVIEINFFHWYKHVTRNIRQQPHSDLLLNLFAAPEIQRTRIHARLERSEFLIYALLTQLDPSQKNWYDRLAEYVFCGLTGLKTHPTPVYAREKNVKPAWDPCVPQSMSLRFRITSTVFYWSLFLSSGHIIHAPTRPTANENLSPEKMVAEMAQKLIRVDVNLLREFYWAAYTQDSNVPLYYRTSMLWELAQLLLLDTMQILEVEKIIIRRDNFAAKQLLAVVGDEETYSTIVDDETLTDTPPAEIYANFKQTWLRVVFLLDWMLITAINGFSRPSVATAVESARKVRQALVKRFLDKHGLEGGEELDEWAQESWEDTARLTQAQGLSRNRPT